MTEKEIHTVKKAFKMIDLDCANCARKMEDAIRKIDGVIGVSVNFLTQKLTLEAEDERFEEILPAAAKCCRRVDPHCEVVIQ